MLTIGVAMGPCERTHVAVPTTGVGKQNVLLLLSPQLLAGPPDGFALPSLVRRMEKV